MVARANYISGACEDFYRLRGSEAVNRQVDFRILASTVRIDSKYDMITESAKHTLNARGSAPVRNWNKARNFSSKQTSQCL